MEGLVRKCFDGWKSSAPASARCDDLLLSYSCAPQSHQHVTSDISNAKMVPQCCLEKWYLNAVWPISLRHDHKFSFVRGVAKVTQHARDAVYRAAKSPDIAGPE